MTATVEEHLAETLAKHMAGLMDEAEDGHCVRIDDVEDELSARLAALLSKRLPQVTVNILRSSPAEAFEIAPERAIELRNRKASACLLLVPAGEGHAASSLDNSYQRVPILDIVWQAEPLLLQGISDPVLYDTLRRMRRHFTTQNRESWVEFVAAVNADPTAQAFGRNLWRLGLIPDFGPDPDQRIDFNRIASRSIARPSRPAATIDDRLTSAGIQSGSWRGSLRLFLDQQGARLANPRLWAATIAESRHDLSFHEWKLTEPTDEDLDSVEVEPFVGNDGSLDKVCKLKLGADGQLILEVPEDGTGSVVVKWSTQPKLSTAVAKWRIDVVPPDDQRTDESESIGTANVRGSMRRATVKVGADEDNLAAGSRFVVTLTALGEYGEEINLSSGQPAQADSQEFQVVLSGPQLPHARRSASPSVPEAILGAALDGLEDLTEDLVSWDLLGQVFGVRLGNRRAIQVRVSEQIIRLQRLATASPGEARHYVERADYGSPLEPSDSEHHLEITLPGALKRSRSDFLTLLGAAGQRDTAESAQWTVELRTAAKSYLASFRRALDSAEPEGLQDLLLLDSMSLAVRRNDHTVRAVVLLPIHPLRLAWIAEHDSVLRSWTDQLLEVTPRGARPSHVDRQFVSQIVPANLPFSVIDHEGRNAVYAEELTFGTGLYLVPSAIDSDASAESVCSVLGLERADSTMRASSRMVAERMDAYQAAHDPGGTLRVMAISPGSGALLAGALGEQLQPPAEGDDQPEDPRRLEVLAYTDSPSYVRPVHALADLQHRMRDHEFARRATHLSPPLSLSVRPISGLLDDASASHLAVIEDLGTPTFSWGQPIERNPSFRDLLVPVVTRSGSVNGSLTWDNAPAVGTATTGDALATVHRAHQRAIGRLSGHDGQIPVVTVTLDGESQARVHAAHQRADWVIGVDRFVGVDLFETGLPDPFILDYAPDFVEGIGDRLTVTTTHREEVERLLEGAMTDLGLADVNSSVGEVLSTLAVVSGRLALRLLENNTLAREAVSLAALVSHLRLRGELDDLIVVPVDAHPEIFGPAVRGEGTARRCDLLLVRLGARSFKIECVEVKSRKEAKLPQALADYIVDQLEDTRRVLESRFFSDPPRIDSELQRARLTSLLHYYADRSANHGLIKRERIADVHKFIDRVDLSGEPAEISMHGYVISIDGDQGFKKRYGDVPMTVLTADDLGQLGFTTIAAPPVVRQPYVSVPSAGASEQPSPEAGPEDSSAQQPAQEEAVGASATPAHPTPIDPPPPRAPAPSPPSELVSIDPSEPEPGSDPQPEAEPEPEPEPEPVLEEEKVPGEVSVVLGKDRGSVPVRWRISTKGSPHAFVIGIPGQGKSVTTRRIINEFSKQGLPALVFDFHGDMAADPPMGAVVLNAALGLPFSPFEPDVGLGRPINTTAWEIAEVIGYVAKLGDIQRNHVYRALQQAYTEHGWIGTTRGQSIPTMEDFVTALEAVETGAAGKNAAARLQPFTDFGLFAEKAEGRFEILTEQRHGWVIDVSQLGLEEVQRFAASFLLRRVYREMFSWHQDSTMKLAVVLDEAHRMAKDVTLPKVMKEGRKYGLSVVVASQSSEDFHKDVLANAGTKIVFRTNFPASKAVSGFLRGRAGVDLAADIERLDVGVAFVSTPDAVQARKVYMDPA